MKRPFTPGERVRVPVQVQRGETRLVPGIVSEESHGMVCVYVALHFSSEPEGRVYEGFYRPREVRRGWEDADR